MLFRFLIAALVLLTAACSSAPTNGNGDELPTGDSLAKNVGERTRTAEKNDKTGIIVASSEDGATADEKPAEPPVEPPAEPPVVTFHLAADGSFTAKDGSKLEAVPAPATPESSAVIVVDETTEQGATVKALDQLKAAGWTRIAIESKSPEKEPEAEKASE